VVENGRFTSLEPDPTHPTGKALCAKGRAGPELVYHPDRLLYPMKRTRPKGDTDPGWQRISWDEALDTTAANLLRLAEESGPESVVFSLVSPSTSASDDSADWVLRLMNAFGSQNLRAAMELCGWGRHLAPIYTYGAGVPGSYMPDLENAGCILFWGYNPNNARLAHATATTAALKRGARLIVVDPRRTGPAKKADVWLQVRPGTDGALALGLAHVMIQRGWYDRDFVRDWSNGPLLVRSDNGRILRGSDLIETGSPKQYVAWNEQTGRPMLYGPAGGGYEDQPAEPALFGTFTIETVQGRITCRPAFELVAELCRRYPPERVEAVCGVAAGQVEQAARLLWEARPVAYYAWSGRGDAEQCHPDRPSHRPALCPDRQPRPAGRQCTVYGHSGGQCGHLGRNGAGPGQAGPRFGRAAAGPGPLEIRDLGGDVPGYSGRPAIPGAGDRRLRIQPAAGPRQQPARPGSTASP
jgi:anaerobic selenocysteine-containing dehydrogenase